MIDAALAAALDRLDRTIDAVGAAAITVEQKLSADSDNALRREVRAVIAELDLMLGRSDG